MEGTDYAALEDRPEAFDGLSMDCANDILALRMVNGRVREVFIKTLVPGPLIGAKQADFMRHRFANEGGKSGGIHVRDLLINLAVV